MAPDERFNIPQEEPKIDESGNAWLPLVRCFSESDYSFTRMLLDSEEIDYILENDFFSGNNPFLPHTGTYGGPLFRVPEDQFDRARQILEESAMASEDHPNEVEEESGDDDPQYRLGLFARMRRFLFPS